MNALRALSLILLLCCVYGQQNQAGGFDLNNFDFSNFGGNQGGNSPTNTPAGFSLSGQASANNAGQPMGAPQQNFQQPMSTQVLSNQQGNNAQNFGQPPNNNQMVQNPNIQSSQVNTLTPEESWLTVGGSQIPNANSARMAPNQGIRFNNNNQFQNPNGFGGRPGNFQRPNGLTNQGPQGFTNQMLRPGFGPPQNGNRMPQFNSNTFELFGTPGNDGNTFNVNAMGQGPSDFSEFSSNPFVGTPFGQGLQIDPSVFGRTNGAGFGVPGAGNLGPRSPRVNVVNMENLPPSVQMALRMNGRNIGGFLGPTPRLPGLGGFAGFQPSLFPTEAPRRSGVRGFLTRLFG